MTERNEKEKQAMQNLQEIVPKLSDRALDRLLAFVDGLVFATNREVEK